MKKIPAYFAAIILALIILVLGPPVHGLAYILNKLHDWFEQAAEHTSLF
jgi:hypothetical protein